MQNMGVLPGEVIQFINTDWMPRIIQAGLKNVALVLPKSAAADYSVERVKEDVSEQRESAGVEEATFFTIDEARAWISKQ